MNFNYTAWVPSLQKDIFLTELTTRQQKELVKAIQRPFNSEFIENVYSILKENSSIDIDNLTVLDKMSLLLKLRIMSISNDIEYQFTCESCNKNIVYKLKLVPLLNKINQLIIPESTENVGQYFVKLNVPTIKTEKLIEESNLFDSTNEIESYYNNQIKNLLLFITEIYFGAKHIVLSNMPIAERKVLIEHLSPELVQKVLIEISSMKLLANIPLIDVNCLCGKKIFISTLRITSTEYSAFLKSLFNENLHNIYEHIYYMTTMLHFDPTYIEKMTPGEREVYWGYFHRDEKKKQKNGMPKNDLDIPLDVP